MIDITHPAPAFSAEEAQRLALDHFGISGSVSRLESERDQNFRLSTGGGDWVLKIVNASEPETDTAFQIAMLQHLDRIRPGIELPHLRNTLSGAPLAHANGPEGERHAVRMVSWMAGRPLAQNARTPELLQSLGATLGLLDRALQGFIHPGALRSFDWDIRRAGESRQRLPHVRDDGERALLRRFLDRFDAEVAPRLPRLRAQVIHNDANDWNVLIDARSALRVAGLIDFGDALHSVLIAEVAVACAYSMLDMPDPIGAATRLVAGFHAEHPLLEEEIDLLFDLIVMRLTMSVTLSAARHDKTDANPYLAVSEAPAWRLLKRLGAMDRDSTTTLFRRACGFGVAAQARDSATHATSSLARLPATLSEGRTTSQIVAARKSVLLPNLSISYTEPIKFVRGQGVWLIDERGRAYLDCFNNVCHLGHAHPDVVEAIARQAAILNTNTRYLHDLIVDYAERLTATLPPELCVSAFTCSGSEANSLMLRMARAHTGRADAIVLDWGYHGTTPELIDLSAYKYKRKGGKGRPSHVFEAAIPDSYRAPPEWPVGEYAERFAESVAGQIAMMAKQQRAPGIFLAESIPSVAGQVFLPEGYLQKVYAMVRATGGVCVADEVQVGFGRVGSHWWAFETQGVVPDIVTMGKPIGNGHPMAALVTTREIADSFDDGMEYFNTFGGNPVSCAAGLAVLDVIERDRLRQNASAIGDYLMQRFRELQTRFDAIGDVRGMGLFLGIELVQDRKTKAPATALARQINDEMKARGVLIGTEGPCDNVLKMRPPMIFSKADADYLVEALAEAFLVAREHPRPAR